jgi:molybdopterin-synthase adenylyltransferase
MKYSRQELVIGKKGQKALQKASIVIIGVGALGSVAAELLCRAGVGRLLLIDRDVVEISNLQRQLLYGEKDVGKFKVNVAVRRLKQINSDFLCSGVITDLNFRNVDVLSGYDLVLDCSDNLSVRFLLNEYCSREKIPWVYAGAIGEQGNVLSLIPGGVCFRCLFSETSRLGTCDTVGVLNTVTTAIAALQVQEALKILTGHFDSQRLFRLNLKTMQFSSLKVKKDKKCRVCSGEHRYLNGASEHRVLVKQCSSLYQFFLEDVDLNVLKKRWKKLGSVKSGSGYLFWEKLSVFSTGKVFVRAKSMKEAKSLVAKYVGM